MHAKKKNKIKRGICIAAITGKSKRIAGDSAKGQCFFGELCILFLHTFCDVSGSGAALLLTHVTHITEVV